MHQVVTPLEPPALGTTDAVVTARERWEIPESGRTGGIEARPPEYERRVVGFFERALLS